MSNGRIELENGLSENKKKNEQTIKGYYKNFSLTSDNFCHFWESLRGEKVIKEERPRRRERRRDEDSTVLQYYSQIIHHHHPSSSSLVLIILMMSMRSLPHLGSHL
jgi:hypothetical protein